MNRMMGNGGVALLIVFIIEPVACFHVWYDGGHTFGTLHYPGSTEQCPLPCPAGYGCVIRPDNATTCGRCSRDAVSAEHSASCHSCKYADESSWGYWSSVVKTYLSASEDQSHCEVSDKGYFWWIIIRNAILCLGVWAAFTVGYILVLLFLEEHRLHRLIRKSRWKDAKDLLENPEARKVLCGTKAQSVVKLVNRQGKFRDTPLELVLAQLKHKGYSLRDDVVIDEKFSDWRDLTRFMLEQREDTPSDAEPEERSSTPNRCSKSCVLREYVKWNLTLIFWAGSMWSIIFNGAQFGGILDHGDFSMSKSPPPATIQECGYWCTFWSIAYGIFACLLVWPGGLLMSQYSDWVFTLMGLVKRNSDASHAKALGGIVLTTLLSLTMMTVEGTTMDYGGMNGGGAGLLCAVILTTMFGRTFIENFVIKKTDPYSTTLKRLVLQNKHGALTLWPLVRTCIDTTGPRIWELIIPLRIESAALERARAIVAALATNTRSKLAAKYDNAPVLRTLLEAHIAGIVDTKACAKCIRELTSRDPAALLHRGTEQYSPAEMAMQASFVAAHSDVKREALIVLFHRFAIVTVEERIYESATCRVYRAEDLTTGDVVAIKLFSDTIPYAKEIAMRDSLDFDCVGGIEGSVVKDILRYDHHHVEEDCKRVVGSNEYANVLDSKSSSSRVADTELFENRNWKSALITTLFEGFGSGAIVMPLANYDLNNRLSLTRIAGIDAEACVSIIRPIVAALAKLHSIGVVHADLKPRNIVFVNETWKLIDLDSAHPIGNIIDTSAEGFKWTSGFASPELARCRTARRCKSKDGKLSWVLSANPKMDIFSLGILAFELMTGQPLFPQDTCNNNIIDPACVRARALAMRLRIRPSLQLTPSSFFPLPSFFPIPTFSYSDTLRLCLWLDITDVKLYTVFSDADARCSKKQRRDARCLIRACLQGDPDRRPTMKDLLKFSFLKEREESKLIKKPSRSHVTQQQELSSRVSDLRDSFEHRLGLPMPSSPMTKSEYNLLAGNMIEVSSAIDTKKIKVLERDSVRERYHIFISHTQTEASGDVGSLFFLFEQMGVHGWRDMNQTDLTEEGMRRGVYDSDVFILFLTNSYLSRKFCLAEITYALEFDKPIIIVMEDEERFWPFDVERWRANRCTKVVGGEWVVGSLPITYEKMCKEYAPICDLIEKCITDGSILPFRRRDFEVNALAREIVHRAGTFEGIAWGSHLPPPHARTSLDESAKRHIFIFARESAYTAKVIQECKDSIDKFTNMNTTWTEDIGSAEHVLMLLTKGCVDAGAPSTALLEEAAKANKTVTFLYVTSQQDEAWDFDEFYALHNDEFTHSDATDTVAAHEALKYRDADPESVRYEHDAMIFEILKRMRVTGDVNKRRKSMVAWSHPPGGEPTGEDWEVSDDELSIELLSAEDSPAPITTEAEYARLSEQMLREALGGEKQILKVSSK